eukprot:963439-Prymnesium_polylepis.1
MIVARLYCCFGERGICGKRHVLSEAEHQWAEWCARDVRVCKSNYASRCAGTYSDRMTGRSEVVNSPLAIAFATSSNVSTEQNVCRHRERGDPPGQLDASEKTVSSSPGGSTCPWVTTG